MNGKYKLSALWIPWNIDDLNHPKEDKNLAVEMFKVGDDMPDLEAQLKIPPRHSCESGNEHWQVERIKAYEENDPDGIRPVFIIHPAIDMWEPVMCPIIVCPGAMMDLSFFLRKRIVRMATTTSAVNMITMNPALVMLITYFCPTGLVAMNMCRNIRGKDNCFTFPETAKLKSI